MSEREQMHIPLKVSLLSSVLVAAGSAGVTWGLYSARLHAAEERTAEHELRILNTEQRVADQDTRLAVLSAQYTEILRRLGSIDTKLDHR